MKKLERIINEIVSDITDSIIQSLCAKEIKAEIERYKGVIKLLEKNVLTAKNEAVKEFAKRLKAEYADFDELHEEIRHDNLILAIDNLVKEMMEQSVNYGSSKTEG